MFARNRQGRSSAERTPRGVVRAARSGGGREIWIREALQGLRSEPGVERCGVWLEAPRVDDRAAAGVGVLRGEVFDSSETFSAEGWSRISLEPRCRWGFWRWEKRPSSRSAKGCRVPSPARRWAWAMDSGFR